MPLSVDITDESGAIFVVLLVALVKGLLTVCHYLSLVQNQLIILIKSQVSFLHFKFMNEACRPRKSIGSVLRRKYSVQ